MAVMEVEGSGRDARLVAGQQPLPQLQEHEVLIKVQAAGVNRPDLLQKRGLYPAPRGSSPYLGLEVCGTIAAIGGSAAAELLARQRSRVQLLQAWRRALGDSASALAAAVGPAEGVPEVGSRVAALTNGGGYAEFVAVPAGQVMHVPDGADTNDWACLPEAAMTAWHNVFERGALAPGSVFLCHGATGSVGGMASRMARAAGAVVVATVRDVAPDRRAHCEAQGADFVTSASLAAETDWFGSLFQDAEAKAAIAALSQERSQSAHALCNPVAGVGVGHREIDPAEQTAAAVLAARCFGSSTATSSDLPSAAGADTLGMAAAQLLSGQRLAWRAAAGAGAADVVLDVVGAPLLAAHLQCLGTEGRLVQIGYMGGSRIRGVSEGPGVDLMRVMLKRLHLTGSTLRSRSDEAKSRIAAAVEALVVPSLRRGAGVPPVAATFPFQEAERAHGWLEEAHTMGKAVLTVDA